LLVGLGAYVVELIDRFQESRSHGALVVGPEGNCEHLESRSVVKLQQLRDEHRGSMRLKVRRQIPQTQLAAANASLEMEMRTLQAAELVAEVISGALQLNGLAGGKAKQLEWRDLRFALGDPRS